MVQLKPKARKRHNNSITATFFGTCILGRKFLQLQRLNSTKNEQDFFLFNFCDKKIKELSSRFGVKTQKTVTFEKFQVRFHAEPYDY